MAFEALNKRKRVLVIGHRGAGKFGVDNSMESFYKAIALKADILELDLRLTKDGKLVVIHDTKIDRHTDGKGKVKNLTLKAIRKASLKNGDSIPTLEEVFQKIGRKIPMLLEIKVEGCERKLINLLRKYDLIDHVMVITFDPQVLWKIKKMEPSIRTGMLVYFTIKLSHLLLARKIHCSAIMPRYKKLGSHFIELAHLLGLKVYVWTVDKPKDMRRLIRMKVDGIVTDKLDCLHHVLHSKNKKRQSFFRRLFSRHT